MAKKESTFLNMTLTLFVITAVAAVALASVYNLTKEPIEKVKEQKLKTAISIVVPGAENGSFEEFTIMSADGVGELTFYKVTIDNEFAGMGVKTFTNNGFSGEIIVMVGFDKDGNIIDSNVLEHKETPGLGDKTSKSVSDWNEQFKGKNPAEYILKVSKDGGNVDAITAATITTRAYCDAIQRAYDTYMKYLSENNIQQNKVEVDETEEENEEIIVETNDGGNE